MPRGFVWGAVRAGIKASGKLDLALAVAPEGANAAAMFTRNRVVAAPLTVGRRHLEITGGRVKAVLVNAGNANCASGEAGIRACLETCRAAADAVGCIFDEVFPSSTGIIGVPLPAEKIVAAIPAAIASLGDSTEHAELFASAIMTTDTRMKVATAVIEADGVEVRLFGTAKGAGMIHPQLGPPHATMLVYLFTDIAASSAELGEMLEPAADASFNSISIDGDTSTNDTVLLLASGASGVALNIETKPAFAEALRLVCGSLAHQIVDDGEGVTHVVTLEVTGAKTTADARRVAKAIAHSPLNKTAWSSADPNWGTADRGSRLLRRVVRSGAAQCVDRRSAGLRSRHAIGAVRPRGRASHDERAGIHHPPGAGRGRGELHLPDLRSDRGIRAHQRGLFDVNPTTIR